MSVKSLFFGLVTSLVTGLATGGMVSAEGIEVHDPYAVSTGVMAQTGAAYMVIHNHGDSDDALLEVRSGAAQVVQLHLSASAGDGVMTMAHVMEPLAVPAGGEVVFDQGGYHIMFMGLTAPFVQGEMLQVTLVFELAGEVVVAVPVDLERLGGMGMSGMDHD